MTSPTGDDHVRSDARPNRRTFLKRSAAASVGIGVGLAGGPVGDARGEQHAGPAAQEDETLDYHNFVVPDRGIAEADYVNKFVFVTRFRRRLDQNPFEGCFSKTEPQVEGQFRGGAQVYDGILVEATGEDGFKLFGGGEGIARLREMLGGNVDLPDALSDGVGAIVGTRVFAPAAGGRLPTTEGYRSVGGERCQSGHVRLRVHQLPIEVTS